MSLLPPSVRRRARWGIGVAVTLLFLGLSFRSVPDRGEVVIRDSPFLKTTPSALILTAS